MTKANSDKTVSPPGDKEKAGEQEKASEQKLDDKGRQLNDDGSVKGSGPQESDDSDTEEALDEVEDRMAPEVEKGLRGTEVDMTPNENYTVEGVGSDPEGVPEAAEFKTEATLEATNPELRVRH